MFYCTNSATLVRFLNPNFCSTSTNCIKDLPVSHFDLVIVWIAVESLQMLLGVGSHTLPCLCSGSPGLPVIWQDSMMLGAITAIHAHALKKVHTDLNPILLVGVILQLIQKFKHQVKGSVFTFVLEKTSSKLITWIPITLEQALVVTWGYPRWVTFKYLARVCKESSSIRGSMQAAILEWLISRRGNGGEALLLWLDLLFKMSIR